MKDQFPLAGKWQIDSIEVQFTEGSGWTAFRVYGPGDITWEFQPGVNNPTLTQWRKEEATDILPFSYRPENRELYLDRFEYDEDGFCWMCLNDIYRIEPAGRGRFLLYRLQGFEYDLDPDIEPGELIRLKMSRDGRF